MATADSAGLVPASALTQREPSSRAQDGTKHPRRWTQGPGQWMRHREDARTAAAGPAADPGSSPSPLNGEKKGLPPSPGGREQTGASHYSFPWPSAGHCAMERRFLGAGGPTVGRPLLPLHGKFPYRDRTPETQPF